MALSRWERLRAQASAWNADRAVHGARHATVLRVRQFLDLGPVTTGRVDQMSEQIEVLRGHAEHFDRYSRQVAGAAAEAALEAATVRETAAAAVASEHDARELLEQVLATTAWLEAVQVADDTLVSVVLPTRGVREQALRRAVDSVRAQVYERWHLVVVVDGDDDTLAAVTQWLPNDERIDIVRSSGTGVSAARNTGLDRARGELIAYLDDDVMMGAVWLRAIAWSSARHRDTDIFYGAELIDEPGERGRSGSLPVLHLAAFDRRRLARGNYIDQNTIAHRRALHEAHYDESLPANVDWEFLVRATLNAEPVMVPVVASYYTTNSPDRLSRSREAAITWPIVRERARALAPIRILAMNMMYPLIAESYIGEELDALAAEGAEIACCVLERRVAPAQSPYTLYHDPVKAVAEHEPDLILLHWAGVGIKYRELLATLGVPYAVRGHSFAVEPEQLPALVQDPLCVGVWAFPQHVRDHPKIHPLPTLFWSHAMLPPPAETRDLVLSLSAGLPKKDFPLLLTALAPLTEVERRIVLGATSEHEHVITELVLAMKGYEAPPLVQVNLTRDQAFGLLARTSAFVYTLKPGMGFGMPMSVVEAMTAGACVILPAFVPAREVFGPDVRTYSSAEDITRHVREVLAGGVEIDAERDRLRTRALEEFCDPEIGKRFYEELLAALDAVGAPVG